MASLLVAIAIIDADGHSLQQSAASAAVTVSICPHVHAASIGSYDTAVTLTEWQSPE